MKRNIATIFILTFTLVVSAQVGNITIPRYGAKPLKFGSVEEWEQVHRPVIMNFFEQEVYGLMPEGQVGITYEVLSEVQGALNGRAIRKEVAMKIAGIDTPIIILMYLPANATGPVPAFLSLNSKGNHHINPYP